MGSAPSKSIRFGDFELDVRAGELRKGGFRIRLQEQPLQILLMLLERPGEVVTREEVRRRLWPNDTVVEFDRIRENRRKYKRMPLRELINLSTNQIATRTTLVSVATSLSVVPLVVWGGSALFDFSSAILFGIFVGTFSSTYVAAALLLYLPPVGGGRFEETAAAQ